MSASGNASRIGNLETGSPTGLNDPFQASAQDGGVDHASLFPEHRELIMAAAAETEEASIPDIDELLCRNPSGAVEVRRDFWAQEFS
eukprot:gene24567-10178_t